MGRDYVAEQQAQQAAWARVQARIASIRAEELRSRMFKGGAQDVIDECLRFLYAERRYEAAREFLSLLIELDKANYACAGHPPAPPPDDTPDYLRTED